MATREVVTVDSIIREARACYLPWKDIAKDEVEGWMTTFSNAKGTCKEFLLASSFPAVSALMGNAVVEIFDGYEERVNLYMLALGGPSTGKTQSHKNCVTQPILHHLEGKVGEEMLLEDATSKGLFRFFTRSANRVALCAIDECQEWFKAVVGTKSSALAPSMKRLLQCYDGSHWYETKGNTNKRVGVPSAAMALSCFTQPEPFLRSIMPRLVTDSNGLLDRFLICLPPTTHVPINNRMECSRRLKDTRLASFDKLYEKIFAKHNTGEQTKYSLEEEALDMYVKHTNDENSSPQEDGGVGNAKDDKNIVRLAAVIHVLFTMIYQALNQSAEDLPGRISARTMSAAIALAGYFGKQRAILRQVT